ncbi:UTP--glucose-1-phosphate uridylyltransferase [Salimicrobium jeotgali]|uniref:UTP--glucose-1-phosphate uridylyltransferase n=1 Tax=Salimicrobium jeotgali TaxID=1230341 RepID=K2GAK1_9BACI|nr:UTP--glucose-1-phosphate uridylyltransferase GalU [Salimicrobium jeotgali]AKG03756.1 UTP--glucose-1-phosphate uridylyltransferase [Salimicrobium jeotgali]EKE31387.1 UTP-glucose-1-phosphate uridylyltransferase [Salimicrobium jeotgali]MBM7696995.1 UTP--glucose-1-phosphate uridylyltransferase [Salimicrobium jeotgali]
MKVKKAIIPAAGLGTRFLPATKAQPKEMLPIVDKPTIQYIVEEAVDSGIEDIIIVSGRGKRAIEDHFDKSYELEEKLEEKEKYDLLKEVEDISNLANIHYIRQKEQKGLGHAIATASRFIGNEPFAVLLGDDIVQANGTPCLRQLMDVYEKEEASVVGVQDVPENQVSSYGIIKTKNNEELSDGYVEVEDLVEKPALEDAPSNLAIMGRYILTPEVFDILETLPPGAGNEIQLTDAIKKLTNTQKVLAYNFVGERFDIGNKLGFIDAQIDFALNRSDLKEDILQLLEDKLEKYK